MVLEKEGTTPYSLIISYYIKLLTNNKYHVNMTKCVRATCNEPATLPVEILRIKNVTV
jgi:hypothetical protein